MNLETFKMEIKQLEMQMNLIAGIVEGPGVGLIGLGPMAKYEPCKIIAEVKHDYHFINEDGTYGSYPKKSYQIVSRYWSKNDLQKSHP